MLSCRASHDVDTGLGHLPQDQPVVRPERHTAWPWNGATVPMILTAEGPGFAALAQVVADGWTLSPPPSASMTAMSVPTLPGASSVPVIGELFGPPNWLNPNVPSGARLPGRGAEPPAGAAVGGLDVGDRRAVFGAVPGRQHQRQARRAERAEPGRADGHPVDDVALPAEDVLFGLDRRALFQPHVGVAGDEVGRGDLPGRRVGRGPRGLRVPATGQPGAPRYAAGIAASAVLVPPVRMMKCPSA